MKLVVWLFIIKFLSYCSINNKTIFSPIFGSVLGHDSWMHYSGENHELVKFSMTHDSCHVNIILIFLSLWERKALQQIQILQTDLILWTKAGKTVRVPTIIMIHIWTTIDVKINFSAVQILQNFWQVSKSPLVMC